MNMVGRNTIAAEALRGFVERVENIDAQKSQLAADRAAILAEAKANGFQTKGIGAIVKLRKMKPSDVQESEALLDSYRHALGMEANLPLFRHVGLMSVDVTKRDEVIEAMKKFVPASGSIQIETGDGKPVRLTRDSEGNISVTEVVEKPVEQPAAPKPGKRGAAKPDVPDVDAAGAETLGRKAYRDDQPVISNPFPYGDARRPLWDKGWRDESGGDGMGD